MSEQELRAELEALRLANTKLRLEVFTTKEAVSQLRLLCLEIAQSGIQWKQVAIAAMVKAEVLERNCHE